MPLRKHIRVSEEVWRRLVIIRDRLTLEKGKDQTIDDAIRYLLEKCGE
ncbi:MAG: hypothetical protein ACP5KE_09790 [Candidatus Methanodesulfokora sp.]